MSTTSVTYSCTPHYKEDADKPWVTLESELAYSIWLSPKSSMTLEDVAKLIESFVTGQISQQLAHKDPVVNYNYEGVVRSMIFRGQDIQRTQMANYSVKDYVREGEPFNLVFAQTFRAKFNPLVFLCPCYGVLCCRSQWNQKDLPPALQQANGF